MQIDNTYQFITYDNSAGLKVGTLKADVSYQLAMQLGYDVVARYEAVVSAIPEELRIDMTKDRYFLFESEGSDKRTDLFCVGQSWIVSDTIEEFNSSSITCRLTNVTPDNLIAVKALLSHIGVAISDVKYD